MPVYQAPVNLSATIIENLNQAEANGNLGALAAGPVTFPVAIAIDNTAVPFTVTIPANAMPYFWTFLETSGTAQTAQINGTTFAAPVTPSTVFIAGVTPTGILSATGGAGSGDVPGVYNNGAGGVGATFTVDPAALPLTWDANAPVMDGDTVGLSIQTDPVQNGIYTYDLTSGVLTRKPGFDTGADWTQFTYFVNLTSGGVPPSPALFVTPGPVTIGVTPINFIFPGPPNFNLPGAPNGLQFTTYTPSAYIEGTDLTLYFLPGAANPGDTPSFGTQTFTMRLYYAPIAG